MLTAVKDWVAWRQWLLYLTLFLIFLGHCSAHSSEEDDDDCEQVGKTKKRVYYGSKKQKTWHKAVDFCISKGYKLLDVDSDDHEEIPDLWETVAENYTNAKGIQSGEMSWTTQDKHHLMVYEGCKRNQFTRKKVSEHYVSYFLCYKERSSGSTKEEGEREEKKVKVERIKTRKPKKHKDKSEESSSSSESDSSSDSCSSSSSSEENYRWMGRSIKGKEPKRRRPRRQFRRRNRNSQGGDGGDYEENGGGNVEEDDVEEDGETTGRPVGKRKNKSKKKGNKSAKTDDECPEPPFEDCAFIRTGPGSKYLYSRVNKIGSAEEVYGWCQEADLEPAAIESFEDFKNLERFVFSKNLDKTRQAFKIAIGGSDRDKPGFFKDRTSGEPIKFQMFPLAHESSRYFDLTETCLAVECDGDGECYYTNVDCNNVKDLTPLCMYKRGSPCYKNSKQVAKQLGNNGSKGNNKADLVKVGEINGRGYYGSRVQKNWEEAGETCEKNGYHLLTLKYGDKNEVDQLFNKIRVEYMKLLDIPEWHALSWTSADFAGGYGKEEPFTWETVGDRWEHTDNEGHWRWTEGNMIKDPKEERCLLLTVLNITSEFGMRPVICDLPNFFLCHDKIEGTGKDGIAEGSAAIEKPVETDKGITGGDDGEEDEDEEEENTGRAEDADDSVTVVRKIGKKRKPKHE